MTAIHFKGGAVVTMDPARGVLPKGDVIVRDGRIAAIGPSFVTPDDAEVIDCEGRILIPGLINAHMHTWQTALRGLAANWTLLEYFGKVHAGLATLFEPEDLYIATRMGAINQIDCGTTTLGDWCHNNPTPAHTDAALDGLLESDIRGVFMHGSPKPDPRPGQPHFSEIPHPRAEIERLARGRIRDRRRVTLAMAILGPHYSTMDVAFHDFRMAQEYGLIASMHQGGGPAMSPGGWDRLETAGLVGHGINIVHGHGLTDEQVARFCARGVSFSTTPENEMTQGHGFPVTGKVRRNFGILSLGVDLESVLSGDMFTVARMALGMQRALDNAESRERTARIPETTTIRTEEALRWITIDGARALGLDHRVGSLVAGKEADITVLDARALNMAPVHDPISTVVMQAGPRNVEHVMILGAFVKRDFALTRGDVGRGLEALEKSGRRIAAELARRTGKG